MVDDDEQLRLSVRESNGDLTGDEKSKGYVDYWDIDSRSKSYTWIKLARAIGTLQDEDLILFGDNDEIPDPLLLLHLKMCQLREDAIPFRFQVVRVCLLVVLRYLIV